MLKQNILILIILIYCISRYSTKKSLAIYQKGYQDVVSVLKKLYCILIERDYIDDNTDKELFLYRFTGLGEPYSKDQTILWKGVDRLLGYIARCLFTYKYSGTEGLGKFGNLFEDEDGKHPYLPSAKHITLEEYHKNPDKRSYRQFKEAIEILQKCGFINVENTSPRGRK